MSATTNTHPHRKPFSLIGMEPVPHLESYDSVPLYRRQWLALFPPLFLALVVIAVTGDVYAKANRTMSQHADAEVWRYTVAARAFFVVTAVAVAAFTALNIWG